MDLGSIGWDAGFAAAFDACNPDDGLVPDTPGASSRPRRRRVASRAGAYLTGAVISVDGGIAIRA